VLNLHRVSPVENPFWPALDPTVFEELLTFLKEHFEVCLFGKLPSDILRKPVAVLSFDDGYYDFVEYALPLIEKYGLQANMNIIPQCIETGMPIWNVRLYDFLNSAPRHLINKIRLPGFSAKLNDDGRAAKLSYGLRLSSFLKNRGRIERDQLWQTIEPILGKADFQPTRMMTAAEVMQISGFNEIGVHSYSHESMGFEENEFFERDFRMCRDYFSERLRLPLSIYAFPNGSYREEQIELLRNNNIKSILLVDEKFAKRETDVFTRLTIYGESKNEICMRAVGF
jgi:peptidoglycan/xylan/chitin deacetylase (PgdA/CDA1 family)